MELQNLLLIFILLIIAYRLFVAKEGLENVSETKECSQKAINEGHLQYVFGTPYFVRPG